MKVLFLRDVKGTAQAGEVKEVAEGFARNYLLPKKLAVAATEGTLKSVTIQKQIEAARRARSQEKASTLAERLSQVTLHFKVRVGEQHRLYGSITSADIAEAVEKQLGEPVDKHKIVLEEPIRHLGEHKVPIKLGAGLEPAVTVLVEREEEAKKMAEEKGQVGEVLPGKATSGDAARRPARKGAG
ncbi:MAG: 50S ribosomal protein L9 [Chloroflexi bacterium]|nr:50S ribosomal protein L9 [Chloroflexota bacterium]